jgi:hypothetical protein
VCHFARRTQHERFVIASRSIRARRLEFEAKFATAFAMVGGTTEHVNGLSSDVTTRARLLQTAFCVRQQHSRMDCSRKVELNEFVSIHQPATVDQDNVSSTPSHLLQGGVPPALGGARTLNYTTIPFASSGAL